MAAVRAPLLLLLLAAAVSAHCPDDPGCPSTANCTIEFYNQTIGARSHSLSCRRRCHRAPPLTS